MKNNISGKKLRKVVGREQYRANRGEAIRDLTKGRICSICEQYKERDMFFEHPSGFNGLGNRCKECLSNGIRSDAAKKLYSKRKNAKRCVACGDPGLVTTVHCKSCWFADRAGCRAGNRKNLQAIIDLWNQQNGKCFYTGQDLIPGVNASLDHQIPTSKGGTDDPSNLKWVTNNINMMKSNMTHDEFILMCKVVLKKEEERQIQP